MSSSPSSPSVTRVPTPCSESKDDTSSVNTSVEDNQSDSSESDFSANDIAIIGMSCRTPGGVGSTAELWDFLLRKGDASGDMPAFRWEPYNSRHPRNADTLAKTTSKGYFLDRLEDFDASFFSVSPREAEQMDPQQRIAVEVAWEALENAGIPPQQLSGTDTAVYMGVNSDDYGKLVLEDLQNIGAHMGVGTAYCGIPSRISYLLNLMGPSIAIDAACASSLVAVHHARQAILAGETELAIAGGVNALIGPGLTRVLDEAGAIASDGICRSFDDSAHGYGRGEGAGVVVLKRLTKAVCDGDRILGVLKGTAVCADGKTVGIMAPNPVAQQIVAEKALREAKVSPETISYVEAHATSTPLGDPTETEALAQVYGYGVRPKGSNPCIIGSIKSNIGHLEAGAGVLSLIKAVMVLQKGIVPPQANLDTLNKKIDWENNMLIVCKDAKKLPPSQRPRTAAIASYGYSGTVSHAIIQASPPSTWPARPESDLPVLLFLSGPQAHRIPKAANALARWLEADGSHVPLEQIAATLASRRGHHRFRASVTARTKEEAVAALDKLSQGVEDPSIVSGRVTAEGAKGPVWVFSGHGSQWPIMGKELFETKPAFASIVKELEPIIREELGCSVTELIASDTIDRVDEIQVLTFVMHIGIATILLEEAGPPAAIVGHSLGETAASVMAGALSLHEGALIVCRRARLYRELMGKGAMILVTLEIEEAKSRIGDRRDISLAIDASPGSCVLSGAKEAILELAEELKRDGIQVRQVRSDVPFHSKMLLSLVDSLRECLQGQIQPRRPRIPLYSTSSTDARTTVLRDIEYWTNNMVLPVLLRSTVKAIAEDGYRAFIEVSSHPIVVHSINEILEDEGISEFLVIPTMIRNRPAMKSILTSMAKLHCFGCELSCTKRNERAWYPEVPGTLWAHEPYWRTVAKVPFGETAQHDPSANNLLGSRTSIWGSNNVLFTTHLDEANKPFPGNHPLHGSEIVPAAVLINTFLHAVPSGVLENVSLKVPVVVSPPRDIQILLEMNQIAITSKLASVGDSQGSDSWLVNTTSRVGAIGTTLSLYHLDVEQVKKRLTHVLPNTFSIDYLAKLGVPDMGFPWKVVEHIENDTEMLAKVETNPGNIKGLAAGMKSLRTSALDAATSVSSTLFYREPKLRMPTSISRVVSVDDSSDWEVVYVYCKKVKSATAADVLVCSEQGKVLIEFEAMEFAGIDGEELSRKSTSGLIHRIAWTPATFAEEPIHFTHVLFLATEENPVLGLYEEQLKSRGYLTSRIHDVNRLTTTCPGSIVVHLAHRATSKETVFEAASKSCENLVSAAKILGASNTNCKLFSIARRDNGASDLGSAPLYGLARIIKSEHPSVWGGLFEVDDDIFPLPALKYVQDEDVVKFDDGVPRTARLRPFGPETQSTNIGEMRFRPEGTYLITGGLGALGLEVASWMAERGARRLLLVSRRKLPRRSTWSLHQDLEVVQRISTLEKLGVNVSVLNVDMSAFDAGAALAEAIEGLSVPPVTGVVHAAGILKDQLVEDIDTEAFDAVLAPKIIGALHLDNLFPVGTLDFFALFSSCGQLLGFPGQASYASGNAFLDALAEQRKLQGDKSISMMWTSWRGLGMAASTEYINAELSARGITDVTKEEAFMAWDRISSMDTSHAVILRALPLDEDEPLPHNILRDVAPRRAPSTPEPGSGQKGTDKSSSVPVSGPELESYLARSITACVATTLGIKDSEIDPTIALSEMGMDSVMTVNFRSKVQQSLKVKMAPTLVWKCPTVSHLVRHFTEELQK